VTNKLPSLLLTHGNEEHWFHSQDEVETYLNEHNLTLDNEQEEEVESESEADVESDSGLHLAHLAEVHEVRTINSGLKDLATLGFSIDDLIPVDRTGMTTPRFELIRGEDVRRPLEDLRELLPEIRAAGEKGLQVTRFKGLGEMNAEELRETTLDPANRTLLKVNLTDAGAADEMFRLLMGDKVEPRRDFIEKHALDVRNLDI
ncbi:MAG: DNA gyrase subunit B, partial [Planctomycetes bacterium]|nr:DNA gyrase subunit B [Planctomycetota bacterium]